MDLCGEEPFWSQELTWDTDLPTFTKCFRRSVFTLAPLSIFSLILPFYVWILRKNAGATSRKISLLSIVKMVSCTFNRETNPERYNGHPDKYMTVSPIDNALLVCCLLLSTNCVENKGGCHPQDS